MRLVRLSLASVVCGWWLAVAAQATNRFEVAFYNLENWLWMDRGGGTNSPKPALARQAAASIIASCAPDLLGVCEIGTREDLADLQTHLRHQGLDYPHTEWLAAADPTRRVALLSRFPILDRRSRTNATYQLDGRTQPMQRGILDVRLQPSPDYTLRAVVVHLKSRRESEEGDQAQMRLAEARLLRAHLDNELAPHPDQNLLVMGDFNDTPETAPLQLLVGVSPTRLLMLDPRDERGFDTTYFWRGKRQWSQFDYLLASPGLANEYVDGSARIAGPANSLIASDHRLIHAQFVASDAPQPRPTPLRPTPPRVGPSAWVLVLALLALLLASLWWWRRRGHPENTP